MTVAKVSPTGHSRQNTGNPHKAVVASVPASTAWRESSPTFPRALNGWAEDPRPSAPLACAHASPQESPLHPEQELFHNAKESSAWALRSTASRCRCFLVRRKPCRGGTGQIQEQKARPAMSTTARAKTSPRAMRGTNDHDRKNPRARPRGRPSLWPHSRHCKRLPCLLPPRLQCRRGQGRTPPASTILRTRDTRLRRLRPFADVSSLTFITSLLLSRQQY